MRRSLGLRLAPPSTIRATTWDAWSETSTGSPTAFTNRRSLPLETASSLASESYETRAEADPYFTKPQAAGLVASYLGRTDPRNPLASPLYGDLRGLPPIRVHVGDDEVLLDDSRRYVERAVAAGVDAELDVWMGMPHGFVTAIREFGAARQALDAIGTFLAERLLQDDTDG
jgi:epsilon-lactone hydrolase